MPRLADLWPDPASPPRRPPQQGRFRANQARLRHTCDPRRHHSRHRPPGPPGWCADAAAKPPARPPALPGCALPHRLGAWLGANRSRVKQRRGVKVVSVPAVGSICTRGACALGTWTRPSPGQRRQSQPARSGRGQTVSTPPRRYQSPTYYPAPTGRRWTAAAGPHACSAGQPHLLPRKFVSQICSRVSPLVKPARPAQLAECLLGPGKGPPSSVALIRPPASPFPQHLVDDPSLGSCGCQSGCARRRVEHPPRAVPVRRGCRLRLSRQARAGSIAAFWELRHPWPTAAPGQDSSHRPCYASDAVSCRPAYRARPDNPTLRASPRRVISQPLASPRPGRPFPCTWARLVVPISAVHSSDWLGSPNSSVQ